ncbi:hypothetical protein EV2_036321 [Malus domestica]
MNFLWGNEQPGSGSWTLISGTSPPISSQGKQCVSGQAKNWGSYSRCILISCASWIETCVGLSQESPLWRSC